MEDELQAFEQLELKAGSVCSIIKACTSLQPMLEAYGYQTFYNYVGKILMERTLKVITQKKRSNSH